MRLPIAVGLSLSLFACAHEPASRAQFAEVPMYSAGEWQAMNAEATVAEIPDHAVPESFFVSSFEDYSSVPGRLPVQTARLESGDDFLRAPSIGSSHFSMHIHTHSFHMHSHR